MLRWAVHPSVWAFGAGKRYLVGVFVLVGTPVLMLW